MFEVPNDNEGHAFLKQLSKYMNHKVYKRHARGRGSRKDSKGAQSHITIANSEWIAVYVDSKGHNEILQKAWRTERAEKELTDVQNELHGVKQKLLETQKALGAMQHSQNDIPKDDKNEFFQVRVSDANVKITMGNKTLTIS